MNRKRKIEFPEDRLRAKYLSRFPLRGFEGGLAAIPGTNMWFYPKFDIFVRHQRRFMQEGYSEEDAFELAQDKMAEKDYIIQLEMRLALENSKRKGWKWESLSFGLKEEYKTYTESYTKLLDHYKRERRFFFKNIYFFFIKIKKKRDKMESLLSEKLENKERKRLHPAQLAEWSQEEIIEYILDHPNHAHFFPFFNKELGQMTEALKKDLVPASMRKKIEEYLREMFKVSDEWEERKENANLNPVQDVMEMFLSSKIGRAISGSIQKSPEEMNNEESTAAIANIVHSKWDPKMDYMFNFENVQKLIQLIGGSTKTPGQSEVENFLKNYIKEQHQQQKKEQTTYNQFN